MGYSGPVVVVLEADANLLEICQNKIWSSEDFCQVFFFFSLGHSNFLLEIVEIHHFHWYLRVGKSGALVGSWATRFRNLKL
jgi:hypothetical protein